MLRSWGKVRDRSWLSWKRPHGPERRRKKSEVPHLRYGNHELRSLYLLGVSIGHAVGHQGLDEIYDFFYVIQIMDVHRGTRTVVDGDYAAIPEILVVLSRKIDLRWISIHGSA